MNTQSTKIVMAPDEMCSGGELKLTPCPVFDRFVPLRHRRVTAWPASVHDGTVSPPAASRDRP